VYPADYPDSKFDAPRPEDKDKPSTDVGPPSFTMGGYEQLVRGEPFRGKFRHSFEKPEAFTPGKVEEINFTMQDVNHTFRRGHRIMVQIQSSWFPLTDRNPQTFVDIPDAKPSDFVKATERLYHAKGEASGIVVGVLPSPAMAQEQKWGSAQGMGISTDSAVQRRPFASLMGFAKCVRPAPAGLLRGNEEHFDA
ncbi:MAG: CocE/NonD family hydrolase C-terminal non-catalytic domain-containing protein, partial [Candidatus Sulfotelmatobacter sp.]